MKFWGVRSKGQPRHFSGDMNTMVYNYHVVRFLPYPETGEFVNVGVILFCPQLGFFDFKIETHRSRRATDSTDIYNHGGEWQLRLARLHKIGLAPEQLILAVDCPADTDGRRATAANEVCQMLREIPHLRLIDFNATDEIINAARVG